MMVGRSVGRSYDRGRRRYLGRNLELICAERTSGSQSGCES